MTIFIMLFGGMFLNVFIEIVNEKNLNSKFCFLKLFILFFWQKCITKIRLHFIKWSFFIVDIQYNNMPALKKVYC